MEMPHSTEEQRSYHRMDTSIHSTAHSLHSFSGSIHTNKHKNQGNPHLHRKWCCRDRSIIPNRLRHICGEVLENHNTQRFIIALIVLNSILLGVQTLDIAHEARLVTAFEIFDVTCLVIFTIEIIMQFLYRKLDLFRDTWLVFDVVIVSTSWVFHSFKVGRAFRILRALLIVFRMNGLKEMVEALINCLPRIFAVGTLLVLILYVYGVVFTSLFCDLYKNGHTDEDYFSRLDTTIFTLFQMMTMDSWSEIAKQVMAVYKWAWFPFICYIMSTTFLVLNMAVGVISSAIAEIKVEEIESYVVNISRDLSRDLSRDNGNNTSLERKVDQLTALVERLENQLQLQQQQQHNSQMYQYSYAAPQQDSSSSFEHSRVGRPSDEFKLPHPFRKHVSYTTIQEEEVSRSIDLPIEKSDTI